MAHPQRLQVRLTLYRVHRAGQVQAKCHTVLATSFSPSSDTRTKPALAIEASPKSRNLRSEASMAS